MTSRTAGSLIAHGLISEPSLINHIGKGREGKGREVGHPSIVSTGGHPLAAWMGPDGQIAGVQCP